ncbi:hypothetical protein HYV57_05670 [Candidatus Peregrinibacteria bacterium]|nr:hypothetical protein [Candidatus Peregrinibacteria bacterium]
MTQKKTAKKVLYSLFAGATILTLGVGFVLGDLYGPDLRGLFFRNSKTARTLSENRTNTTSISDVDIDIESLTKLVLPLEGIELPARWGDLGKQLVQKGVIDRNQLLSLYKERPGFGPDEQKLVDESENGKIKITADNAGFILNMFWALGLSNKNEILNSGPMSDKEYGGAGNFASTGGWTLASGDAMDHFSKHEFIKLTYDQQILVENVSKGIFRPCCNNSTYFPDCNHGMAMFGLLELMASQGTSEADMYKMALQVNAYWFPTTYLTLAKYELKNGISWENVDPKEMLSAQYSSSKGYRAIQSLVQPVRQSGGGGCGV